MITTTTKYILIGSSILVFCIIILIIILTKKSTSTHPSSPPSPPSTKKSTPSSKTSTPSSKTSTPSSKTSTQTSPTTTSQQEVYLLSVGDAGYTNTYPNRTAGLNAANNLGLNAVVANSTQMTQAYNAGADWCADGWTAESDGFPISKPRAGCSATAGIQSLGGSGPYGVNLYGVKPPSSKIPDCSTLTPNDTNTTCIHPFNSSKWSQYS